MKIIAHFIRSSTMLRRNKNFIIFNVHIRIPERYQINHKDILAGLRKSTNNRNQK